MKVGDSWAEGLIYSDWLMDQGRDEESIRWRKVAELQRTIEALWAKYQFYWTPTELRKLAMWRRQKRLEVQLTELEKGSVIVSTMWAQKEVFFSIFIRDDERGLTFGNGLKYTLGGVTSVRRSTVKEHGIEICARKIALRLTGEKR